MSAGVTADELLSRTRALLPGLRDRARECEDLRRIPDETFKEFQQSGLLRTLQPLRWGGLELDPLTLYDCVIEVSSVCGASGWVLGVLAVHHWQLALFPEQAQADVWGEDPGAQISSSYQPTGSVAPVDGGFRLSGAWEFSSGCDVCRWVFVGGLVPEPDGAPRMRTFLLPRADYTIEDNWRVFGLAGTGSKKIVVEDAFVPEHRTHDFLDAFRFESPGLQTNPGPLYRLPFGSVFANAIAVPAIGVARGALEAFRERTRARLGSHDLKAVAEDPLVQARLAETTSEVDAAYALVKRNWDTLLGLVRAGEPLPLDLRARCRWDGAQAVARCVRVVDRLLEASGGHAIFLDQPIQRAFRDAHAIQGHFMNNAERSGALFGRSELGLFSPGTFGTDLFL